jgi:hypothetical protein
MFQNDEITCLRATLADALRRINQLESGKGQSKALACLHQYLIASLRTKSLEFWSLKAQAVYVGE